MEKKEEKIIQDLINKAEKLSSVEISPDNIIKVNLQDFIKHPAKIYHFNNHLYRENEEDKSKWLKTKIKIPKEKKETIKEKGSLESQIKELEERLSELIKWSGNLKNYVDGRFNEIEEKQEEILKELKEYIDNKIK